MKTNEQKPYPRATILTVDGVHSVEFTVVNLNHPGPPIQETINVFTQSFNDAEQLVQILQNSRVKWGRR